MKPINLTVILFLTFLSLTLISFNWENPKTKKSEITMQKDSVLRHVVLFKFKPGTSEKEIATVRDAFSALPSKIPQIASYEWGTNNSPEGLDKGFTHAFFLTFASEEDRAVYLPHPDHTAFGSILRPHLDDVLVIDYWSKNE